MSNQYDYDAVIIGAGISGLVCGCYLAKAGMKVLIIEKNAKPGGYCTSFKRKGFTFDACAHSLGGLGKEGIVSQVIKELDIDQQVKLRRFDPLDIIIAPDYKISFWSNLDKTIYELQDNFPKEAKNISNLFYFINDVKGALHIQLKNKTLKELLDNYFHDYKLKSIFSFLAFGNLGLPPSLLSAFTAVKFYKQFIFDGGYYPGNQIQEFPNALAARFKEYSGKLIYSQMVKKIITEDNMATGIVLNNNESIMAKYVISNCDAMQTFLSLLDNRNIGLENKSILNNLIPSVSFFILYLGIDNNLKTPSKAGTNLWFLSDYDLEEIYAKIESTKIEDIRWFMFRIMPNENSVSCFTNAPFRNKEYWQLHKNELRDIFIKKIECLIPELSKHIIFKDAATPYTLYKWTLNYKGAAYGWAGMPSQFAIPEFSQKTFIQNLYLSGHWTTLAQGIPGVVYLGRDTARIILKRENKIS